MTFFPSTHLHELFEDALYMFRFLNLLFPPFTKDTCILHILFLEAQEVLVPQIEI